MKEKKIKDSIKRSVFGFLCVMGGLATADTYTWVGSPSAGVFGSYGDTNNWTVGGAAATRLPGENDTFEDPQDMWLDLDGKEWTIGTYNSYKDWTREICWLTNGTLKVKTLANWHGTKSNGDSKVTKILPDATFEFLESCTFVPGINEAWPQYMKVYDSAHLNIYGTLRVYNWDLEIKAGGTADISPKEFGAQSGVQHSYLRNSGTMIFGKGVDWKRDGGTDSKGNIYKFDIVQNDGLMIFGGPVNKNGKKGIYGITFNGGTVRATNDVFFAFDSQSIPANKTVTFEVDADKTCDVSNFTIGDNVTLNKTGAGLLKASVFNGTLAAGSLEADAYGAIEFAGGRVMMNIGVAGIPVIASAAVAEGSKIKLTLNNLIGIPNNAPQTVIASCPADADLSGIEIDEAVVGSVAIVDGALVFTKTGVAGVIPSKVWALNSDGFETWENGGWADSWSNGLIAEFNGSEGGAKSKILVNQLVTAAGVEVSGAKDYQFDGQLINAPTLTKSGAGTLTLNNGGVSGRSMVLNGGTLVFGGAADYVTAVTELTVGGVATLRSAATSTMRPSVMFEWNPGCVKETDWVNMTEYANSAEVSSLVDLMKLNATFPTADDSLACHAIRLSGSFYVAADEAGEWTFKGVYDDKVKLDVDGVEIFRTSTYNEAKSGTKNLTAGWHTFVARAYDYGSSYAAANWLQAKKPGGEFKVFTEENFLFTQVEDEANSAPAPERIRVKLVLGADCDFTIGTTGLELEAGSVVDDDAAVRIDYSTIPTHATFIKCSGEVKAALMTKIAATMAADLGTIAGLGAIGEVVSTTDGIAWEMKAIFYGGDDSDITDLLDSDGWRGPVAAPEGENVTITAHAVMNSETPAYGSLAIANGATLMVNATREVNKVTLADGATLAVVPDGEAANTVRVCDSFTTTGDSAVTINVADGCVLDLRGVTLTAGAKLVKTGAGAVLFDQTTLANIKIMEGGVALPADVAIDMSGIEIAEGVECLVSTASGGVRTATRTEDENDKATFSATSITYNGVGDWTDIANWNVFIGVPDEYDAKVSIVGEGTVATLSTVESLPSEIDVGDGAELVITAEVTLPTIKLAPTAKLTLGDGVKSLNYAVSALPITSKRVVEGENGAADAVLIPRLTIAKKVIFKVVGNAYFKNVDLRVYGEIRTSTDSGGLYFGYATAGEVTYFNMQAEGATFHPVTANSKSGVACFSVASPAVGGKVIVVDKIWLKKCSYPKNGWSDYHQYFIGNNNPVDAPFDLVVDNHLFELHNHSQIGGAAHIQCVNGGEVRFTMGHPNQADTPVKAQAWFEIVGANSVLDSAAKISWFNYTPSESDFETIRLIDGGIYKASTRPGGNGNAMLRSEDGVVMIPKMPSSDSELKVVDSYELLKGLKGANIVADKTLTILGEDAECGRILTNGSVAWSQWDRKVTVSNQIAGEGDLVVRNNVAANSMEVTIAGAANTCTGEVRCDGANNAKILFADGANWAGTLAANEAIAFAGDSAAEVTVGNLKLTGAFTLRVWKDANGKVCGSDKVNFDAVEVLEGGAIVLDLQDGAELTDADRVVIGTVPKTLVKSLPKNLVSGLKLSVKDDPSDSDRVLLRATSTVGLAIIIR